jgi:hypothetical protein
VVAKNAAIPFSLQPENHRAAFNTSRGAEGCSLLHVRATNLLFVVDVVVLVVTATATAAQNI